MLKTICANCNTTSYCGIFVSVFKVSLHTAPHNVTSISTASWPVVMKINLVIHRRHRGPRIITLAPVRGWVVGYAAAECRRRNLYFCLSAQDAKKKAVRRTTVRMPTGLKQQQQHHKRNNKELGYKLTQLNSLINYKPFSQQQQQHPSENATLTQFDRRLREADTNKHWQQQQQQQQQCQRWQRGLLKSRTNVSLLKSGCYETGLDLPNTLLLLLLPLLAG